MTKQEIVDAAEACIKDCCAACPLFTREHKSSCTEDLVAAIKSAFGGGIKCSDPRVLHEFGRGHVLQVTLQDGGKEAAQELVDEYVGGYLQLTVSRG